jgi:hypothetical protein
MGFITIFSVLFDNFNKPIMCVSTLILSVLNLSIINNPKDSPRGNVS